MIDLALSLEIGPLPDKHP